MLLASLLSTLVFPSNAFYSRPPLNPSPYTPGLQTGDSTAALDFAKYANRTVMMISAHPDDIEAMSGGLIVQLGQQNTRVVYVIVTNGDKGCTTSQYYNCSSLSSVDIAAIRQTEARAAAALLGVHDVVLLDFEDGMVTRSWICARLLARQL